MTMAEEYMANYGEGTRVIMKHITNTATSKSVSGWDFSSDLSCLQEPFFDRLDRFMREECHLRWGGGPRPDPAKEGKRRELWKASLKLEAEKRIALSETLKRWVPNGFDDTSLGRWVPGLKLENDAITPTTKAQKLEDKLNQYLLGFVLDCDIEMLFNKVFQTRAFNVKHIDELVFNYTYTAYKAKSGPVDKSDGWFGAGLSIIEMIYNRIRPEKESVSTNSLDGIRAMISRIEEFCDNSATDADLLLQTQEILDLSKKFSSKEELIHFVLDNAGSFSPTNRNIAIKKTITEYAEVAWPYARQEWTSRKDTTREFKFVIQKSHDQEIPANALLNIILGTNIRKKKLDETILSKDITKRFPTYATLMACLKNQTKNVPEDALRRLLILLVFYSHCYVEYEIETHKRFCEGLRDYEVFNDGNDIKLIDMINTAMDLVGFPELYPYTIFDALILYCANTQRPLDAFRQIIKKATENNP